MLAHPLETVSREKATQRIAALATEKTLGAIVIGVPRNMNGSIGESASDAAAFAEKLRSLVQCEVALVDERLSTVAAQRALQDAGCSARKSRAVIDQVAAQMILQTFLDRRQGA
jgi:putative Holliday junction resolvase